MEVFIVKRFLLLLTAFFVIGLASCDDDNGSDMEPEPTTIKMKGFFNSVDENNMDDCQSEDLNLIVEDEVVVGSSNFAASGETGEVFDEAVFGYIGIKTQDRIAASYVTATREGELVNPGVLYLRKRGDLYVGFWGGGATRPEGNPSVVCPYIMVPQEMVEEDGCEAQAYAEYLKNEDGSIKACVMAPNS